MDHVLGDADWPKAEGEDFGGQIYGILGVELAGDCVEPGREQDRTQLGERIKDAERRLDKFLGWGCRGRGGSG